MVRCKESHLEIFELTDADPLIQVQETKHPAENAEALFGVRKLVRDVRGASMIRLPR